MKPVLPISERQEVRQSLITTKRLSNETIFITICSLSAFLIRLFLIPGESVIGWDGVYYANLGREIVSGNVYDGISAYWSPLYSFLAGIFSLFFQDTEFAGRFVSLIAGTLLVIPVYYLIRDFYDSITAYLGTILVVIHPGLIRSSMWVMTESLYILIFTIGILTAWYAFVYGRRRDFLVTGILFGLAYLLKPEAIGFLGLFYVLLIGSKLFDSHFSFRHALNNYLLLLLFFSIFFLPYVAFLYQKTGHLTISQKLLNNFTVVDYGKGSLELINNGQITMKDQLFGDIYKTEKQNFENSSSNNPTRIDSPPTYLRFRGLLSTTLGNLKKLVKDFTPEVFPYPILFIFLIIIGFFYKPWTRSRTIKEIYLFSFVVSTYIGYAATVIQVRYLYPLLPIFIAWLAYGIVQLSDWTTNSLSNLLQHKRKINKTFVQFLVLLFLSAVLVYSIPSQLQLESRESLPFEEKQAGLWIKNQSEKPVLIMSHSPIVAYYARANHLFLPNEDFSTVLEYAKRKNVDYLVFSKRRFKDTPKFSSTDEQIINKQLKLVYQDTQSANNEIFIYQLRK
jgi:4-amino-4-deoxy-L-arabinose transferase-like glycosyltransferase